MADESVKKPQPVRAYERMDFLNSPPARTLRILAEYLEPQLRFRKERVRDTVVFFGSARMVAREEAERALAAAQHKARAGGKDSAALLETAQRAVEMSQYYEAARELARRLTEWSRALPHEKARFVVCSGGGPGIMEAANRGAHDAGGRSVGLGIVLPTEQEANPYITDELNFEFHYFFMRKYWFAYLAKALIVFPGGFGTMDELFEILTLVQTRKISKKIMVLIYGRSYWNRVLNFDEMVRLGMIGRQDLDLFRVADTPDEAFGLVREYLEKHYLAVRGGVPFGP